MGRRISVVVPAYNEEGNIAYVVSEIQGLKKKTGWDIEIVVADDNSKDGTGRILDNLSANCPYLKVIHRSDGRNGIGAALIDGTRHATGDIIVWLMGDRSDNPLDLIGMVNKLDEGYDLVCGSRFIKKGSVHNYPFVKLISNRLFNNLLRLMFLMGVRDITNAFKVFRRDMLGTIQPLSCKDFDITIELPLKAKLEGLRISEAPVTWQGRVSGISNLRLGKMASKYLSTSLRIWVETLRRALSGKHGKHKQAV